jgi:hypothetical protein
MFYSFPGLSKKKESGDSPVCPPIFMYSCSRKTMHFYSAPRVSPEYGGD